ncbi:TIGR03773 family transporter-associated surface protein [Actinomadura sp. 6N118]|uniref:TIGR03773 family transporter-associated surface protein n=1 Tax=Actinomadura sp. 6N118 TaxID=3375151 RepID=UPI00379F4C77
MRRTMPGRRLLLGIAGLATLALLAAVPAVPVLATPAEPSAPQTRRVINDIHADLLDPVYEGGALRVRTRIGTTGSFEFADPGNVVVQLKDNADSKLSVPEAPDYAFLGAPGNPVWVAPELETPGLIWPGWSTENLPHDIFEFGARTVEVTLTEFTGPGRLEVFNIDGTGLPVRLFSSADAQYKTFKESVGTHHHVNWAFTALGAYSLTFEVAATDKNGTRHVAAPVTLNWYVGGTTAGDVPPELVTPTPTTTPTVTPTITPTVTPTTTPTVTPTTTPTTTPTRSPTPGPQPSTPAPPRPSTSPSATRSPGGGGGGSGGGGGANALGSAKCVPPTPSGSGGDGDGDGDGSPSTEKVVLDDGHVDYAARVVGGGLQSAVKDGTQAGRTTWREPSAVVFHLKAEAATQVPAGFGFLGSPGSRIWQIPQTQKAGVPWLGWNTEELRSYQVKGDISWSLDKVEGPGTLAVYEYSTFGQPRIIFNSGDGMPDAYGIRLGTHAHGNWAFTKEGIYKATFTHTATLASGAKSSDTEVVTFAVGNVDPRSAQASGATPQSAGLRPLTAQSTASSTPMSAASSTPTSTATTSTSPSPSPSRAVSSPNACRTGKLPFTGSALLVPAGLGAALLAAGGTTVGLTFVRRRRTGTPTDV